MARRVRPRYASQRLCSVYTSGCDRRRAMRAPRPARARGRGRCRGGARARPPELREPPRVRIAPRPERTRLQSGVPELRQVRRTVDVRGDRHDVTSLEVGQQFEDEPLGAPTAEGLQQPSGTRTDQSRTTLVGSLIASSRTRPPYDGDLRRYRPSVRGRGMTRQGDIGLRESDIALARRFATRLRCRPDRLTISSRSRFTVVGSPPPPTFMTRPRACSGARVRQQVGLHDVVDVREVTPLLTVAEDHRGSP